MRIYSGDSMSRKPTRLNKLVAGLALILVARSSASTYGPSVKGFDPGHSANLFGAFQCLHSSAEIPGNGIGLATVQRVVQRQGGMICAESQLDRGATFYFTLTGGNRDGFNREAQSDFAGGRQC